MKKLIFFFLMIPVSLISQPRYKGGDTDGYSVTSIFTNLGGTVFSSKYKGGSSDGYNFQRVFGSLSGGLNAGRFFGGDGDGYTLLGTFNSLSGNIATSKFMGGASDGYTFNVTFNSLAGGISSIRYQGGNGGGFAASSVDVNALPVELSLFNGEIYEKRNVRLRWKTESELNNSGFEIQRGVYNTENMEWIKVGYVSGAGTTNNPKEYLFNDARVETGKYLYRLKQIDNNGNYNYFVLNSPIEVGVPNKFAVSQNYPNPFNPTTKIDLDIPKDGIVHLKIYDIAGREIAVLINGEKMTAGYYTKVFNALTLSSGTYFYVVQTEGQVISKRMVLIK